MENLHTNKKLTPQLWELYNFIKERTLTDTKTTVKDICEEFPKTYHLNSKECNFSNCPKLYEDIDFVNSSEEIEKIIIKDHNNFYLATEEQAKDYANRLFNRALKTLKKYYVVDKKIKRDGQGKILSCQLTPIDEQSQAREFVESFIRDTNDQE